MMFSIGTRVRRIFSYGLWAGLASIALAGAVTTAQSATLTGTFGFTIWQANVVGADINSDSQQAELGNPLMIDANIIATGTYTGLFDFDDQGVNTIGSFFANGGGTFSPTYVNGGSAASLLSTSGFDVTTVMLFTGDTGGSTLTGVITHDDGMSLYLANDTPVVLAPGPVTPTPTNYAGLSGSWQLVYVAANGLPEVLLFEVTSEQAPVPLPAALPLFLTALGGMGAIGGWRRRKAKQAA